MNRRTLLQRAAFIAVPGMALPRAEVRQSMLVGGDTRVRMVVNGLPTSRHAEQVRRFRIGQPFESFGEWYVTSTEKRSLPDDLESMPAAVTYHTTVVGVAAAKGAYLVGAFRRDIVCIAVRITGDKMDLMTTIARHLAATPVPDPLSLLWFDTALTQFFPTEETLGVSVEIIEDLWP